MFNQSSKHRPEQIFLIGGSPCAGKSSVSQLLASRYNLRLYQVDFELRGQMDRIVPTRHPTLSGWLAASSDQRWLKPIDELVDDAIGCYRDHFSLIVEDLLLLHEDNEAPHNRATLMEGTALLPGFLAAEFVPPHHAIWMVPTPAFQLKHYRRRPWVKDMLADCSDAELAFENWMVRDIRFAQWVAEEAVNRGYTVMWVDGNDSIESNSVHVAAHFGLEAGL